MRDKIVMLAVKSGRAVPPRMLQPPPEVQRGLELYMKAFFDLAGDRPEGGRIPWSTIQGWCEAKRLDDDTTMDVHELVRKLDLAYIDWSKGKRKRMSADKARVDEAKDHKQRGIPTGVRR